MSDRLGRFKKSKFGRFVIAHKKGVIAGAAVFVVALAIIIPSAINSGAYHGKFDYALQHYKEEARNETSAEASASFAMPTAPEEIEGRLASLSNIGLTTYYEADIPETGYYRFYLPNCFLSDGFKDSEFDVIVDQQVALSRGKIRANFKNASEEFKTDSYGNEICPAQDVIASWNEQGIYDYQYSTPLPFSFYLEGGHHDIELSQIAGNEIALGELTLKKERGLPSFSDYFAPYSTVVAGKRIAELEGEHFAYKNDTAMIPASSSDINASPYKTVEAMLNVVANFSSSTQRLTYEFDVPEAGLYQINCNVNVSTSNHVSFATIFIDGEVPFGELLHYPFAPTRGLEQVVLGDGNGAFSFYLEAGRHSLSFKIDQSLYRDIVRQLEESINELNSIYLSLKRIAGTVSDNNKQWDPDTDFPGIKEKIEGVVDALKPLNEQIYTINGSKANFQTTINISTAITSIQGILKDPRLIPNQYAKFSEGSGSIIEHLANAQDDLSTSPIEIDRIVIGSSKDHGISDPKGGWDSFIEKTKKFFISFFHDYSGKPKGDKTLEIWVARSRQYVDLMQELIDSSSFKEDTGYDVKFVILSDESKLILSNAAKISPDGVMGISNWLPYEMGIRDLTVDLTKFEDYGDVISRFSTGAMISLIADGRGLALPETQDFYVMYRRKDICQQYGFDAPDTWDDLIGLLPKMQRNGFNFYIPLSTSTSSKSIMTTAPFIYQYGGNLFSDDGLRTTLDEEPSLNGIKAMTELFTLYGLESQVANFFNSFRNGSLPIGVSTFDTYVKLSLSAPELANKWDIMIPPGVERDGQVQRWQTGSAQSMCLIDKNAQKNAAGWELLKWWSSKSVQSEFAKRLSLQYGKGYIWNSANLEAFGESIIFTDAEKQTILNQWQWMREIPRVPGWYMLERELSNSWNSIVLKGQNTRACVENAVDLINKELTRKLEEFGYLDSSGKSVKPYKVTTMEMVKNLQKGGH